MKRRVFGSALAALAVISLVVTGCGAGGGGGTTSGNAGGSTKALTVLKVATQSPLSGDESVQGLAVKNGVQMQINMMQPEFAKLGFKIEIDPQDDKGDPTTGVANAQKLVSDDAVIAGVGHLDSGVMIPSEKTYHDGKLAFVSPANTNPKVTSEWQYPEISRIVGRDDIQGPTGAVFAKDKLGVKSVFIIDNLTAYGTGVAKAFEAKAKELGMNVVGYQGVDKAETDFSNVLTQIAAQKPDMVYYGGLYQGFGLLLNQAAAKGIKVKWMGPDGTYSVGLLKVAKDNAVGVYATSVAAPTDTTEAGKTFIADYKKQYGEAPDPYAVYGYDAAGVVLTGIKDAIIANGGKKPTREQVAAAIRKVQYQGALVKVAFDSKGDNKYAGYYVYEITGTDPNGTWSKLVATYDPTGQLVK